ncbi:unnamed protein product [Rhizophagus irregularis]|nr:unnamed protein product [Rhizophagus irregularis]
MSETCLFFSNILFFLGLSSIFQRVSALWRQIFNFFCFCFCFVVNFYSLEFLSCSQSSFIYQYIFTISR